MMTSTLFAILVLQSLLTVTLQEICENSGVVPVDRVPEEWGPMQCSPALDPKRHLNVRPSVPESMKLVQTYATMKDIGYTDEQLSDMKAPSKIGIIKPFKLLTDEGLRVAQNIIDNDLKKFESSSKRIPRMIRATGYRSKFFFDLMESPEIIQMMSTAFQADLIPHPVRTQNGHINLSAKGGSRVDKWHLDSTSVVFSLCLRNSRSTEYGKFRFIQKNKWDAEQLLTSKGDNLTRSIKSFFLQPGEVLLAQGAFIYHDVVGVPEEYGERITYILSFMPKHAGRLHDPLPTLVKLYDTSDPVRVIIPEYTGYAAYKIADAVRGALESGRDCEVLFAGSNLKLALNRAAARLENLRWTIPYTTNRTEIQHKLLETTNELINSARSSKLVHQILSKVNVVADEIANLEANKADWKFIY